MYINRVMLVHLEFTSYASFVILKWVMILRAFRS